MYKRILGCLILILVLISAVSQRVFAVTTHLRVAFNIDQAPYHFVDENGKAKGLHIDMLECIAQSAGYTIEYVPLETSTACIAALNNGDVDLIIDVLQKYPNSKWMSDALSEETVCTFADISKTTADYEIVTYQLGTITPAIAAKLKTNLSIATSSPKESIDYLVNGKADVMVGIKQSILYYMKDSDVNDSYAITNNFMGMISFALKVPDNDYHLLQTLNREIAELRTSDEYNEMRKNWSYQEDEAESNYIGLKRLVIVLAITVVVLSLYASTVTLVRRALKKQVDKQTISLQKANTEIRQQMEQLEAENDIRNRIIEYSHLGMVLFDRKYTIKLINDSAINLSGEKTPYKDIRKMNVFGAIIRSNDVQQLFQKETSKCESVQTILLKKDEHEFRYRYSFQKIIKAGEVWAILLTVEDITDEEARRQLMFEEEKSKQLNQIVASISHEIKNPLTSIKTFVDGLNDFEADPQFMQDFSYYVPKEVERINRLVEGLISYAKPAKGIEELLDLTTLVWDAVIFARSINRIKQIQIYGDIEDGHKIIGNHDQIKQVLINIIMNGIESMQEKLCNCTEELALSLTITLSSENDDSVIIIRDEGMGMAPEAIKRCMDPFFTTKRTGTGLGLTLSEQYTRENNGHLRIESQVGSYTEIQIRFRRENYAS